jgi:hypothetical protein
LSLLVGQFFVMSVIVLLQFLIPCRCSVRYSSADRSIIDQTLFILPMNKGLKIAQIHKGHEAVTKAFAARPYPSTRAIKAGFMPGRDRQSEHPGRNRLRLRQRRTVQHKASELFDSLFLAGCFSAIAVLLTDL